MAFLLVALFVLVPMGLLVFDLGRGGKGKTQPYAGPSHSAALGDDGTITRGPRPNWPRKPEAAPASGFRPSGRRDFFGDAVQ